MISLRFVDAGEYRGGLKSRLQERRRLKGLAGGFGLKTNRDPGSTGRCCLSSIKYQRRLGSPEGQVGALNKWVFCTGFLGSCAKTSQ